MHACTRTTTVCPEYDNLTKIVHKCLHYHVNLFHLRYWWDWKIWASVFNTDQCVLGDWCNLGVVCTGLYRKVFKDHTYSLYFRESKERGFTVVYLLWNVIQINLPTRLYLHTRYHIINRLTVKSHPSYYIISAIMALTYLQAQICWLKCQWHLSLNHRVTPGLICWWQQCSLLDNKINIMSWFAIMTSFHWRGHQFCCLMGDISFEYEHVISTWHWKGLYWWDVFF